MLKFKVIFYLTLTLLLKISRQTDTEPVIDVDVDNSILELSSNDNSKIVTQLQDLLAISENLQDQMTGIL